jgi:hypothetical protein
MFSYRRFSCIRVNSCVVSPCTVYTLSRVATYYGIVYVYTEHDRTRCVYVCVYKSDLIALDDSSANIRALTADARTFITSEVDAGAGASYDIEILLYPRAETVFFSQISYRPILRLIILEQIIIASYSLYIIRYINNDNAIFNLSIASSSAFIFSKTIAIFNDSDRFV